MNWLRHLSTSRAIVLAMLWPCLWIAWMAIDAALVIVQYRSEHPGDGGLGLALPLQLRLLLWFVLPPLFFLGLWAVVRWTGHTAGS